MYIWLKFKNAGNDSAHPVPPCYTNPPALCETPFARKGGEVFILNLVEAAGIEPASANSPPSVLHA